MARSIKNTATNIEEQETVNEIVADEAVVEPVKKTTKTKPAAKKEQTSARQFAQTDLILCRSVTPGWLGVSGKSGAYYVFNNVGDETEIEYQDLMALKSKRSRYLYDPLFVIEDDELLANPRWKDIATFYEEEVYGIDDIDEVLNIPVLKFKSTLQRLPKGLVKALTVEVAHRIEEGTFDSLKKIKIIDEVCGTDFRHILADDE